VVGKVIERLAVSKRTMQKLDVKKLKKSKEERRQRKVSN
jgi:hypothetical protein